MQLHCYRNKWLSQTNLLPPLSIQMYQMQLYLLPIIHDIMQWIFGYKYSPQIDISMKYYMFELDEDSQGLCNYCNSNISSCPCVYESV